MFGPDGKPIEQAQRSQVGVGQVVQVKVESFQSVTVWAGESKKTYVGPATILYNMDSGRAVLRTEREDMMEASVILLRDPEAILIARS